MRATGGRFLKARAVRRGRQSLGPGRELDDIGGNRHERRFWQAGGGFDRNTIEPDVILAMIDYIHGNTVRKQLVDKPEDWKWSSAGWV